MTINSIQDVSGTAYFVAHYRALESEQSAPLFVDPWAKELAGERGPHIMQQLPGSDRVAWVVSLRTAVLDQFIMDALSQHQFDTVVSLGAGLDTRAFRLPLRKTLRWFEIDTAEIIAHKRRVLGSISPHCAWTPLVADLSIDAVRKRTLHEVARESDKILVLTEGLLEYLSDEAVRTLAHELYGLPSFHTWMLNLYGDLTRNVSKRWRKIMARENARVRFTPKLGTGFFAELGFHEVAWQSLVTKAIELERMPLASRLAVSTVMRLGGSGLRARIERAAQVARLERASGAVA